MILIIMKLIMKKPNKFNHNLFYRESKVYQELTLDNNSNMIINKIFLENLK